METSWGARRDISLAGRKVASIGEKRGIERKKKKKRGSKPIRLPLGSSMEQVRSARIFPFFRGRQFVRTHALEREI